MLRTGTRERLQRLQGNRSNIRNMCILAHVDHGKTTLADSLIASNGIISQRQAGKLRYMDSRHDEQERGITMKSSAIALQFIQDSAEFLVNLIDSPGHVDFSSEVSTAVRLCDGAVVLVDAVEGVCPQTQMVLRQAWQEAIKPCLVINKVDRLITELRLSPTEAFYRLQQVLEQVNAVMASLFTTKVMADAASRADKEAAGKPAEERGEEGQVTEEDTLYDWSAGLENEDDSSLYFSPEFGNVIFASALDGWGFGIGDFATLFAKKLGIRADVLRKTLWGDFYLNSKAKRIYKGAQAKAKKPLFVQFVLENIWAVYEAVLLNRDKSKIEKIVNSLGLKIPARDTRHSDAHVHLTAILSQWLPLATATLNMVVEHLPSPLQLTTERVERLMCSGVQTFDSFPSATQAIRDVFLACRADSSAPTILYVSKLFAMDSSALPENKSHPLSLEDISARREAAREWQLAKTAEECRETKEAGENSTEDGAVRRADSVQSDDHFEPESTIFLAFTRVFSGTVRKGQPLFVLHPRHDPRALPSSLLTVDVDQTSRIRSDSRLPEHVTPFVVSDLFVLMGRGLVPMGEVPAGNVVGVAGLEELVLKSATVSSSLACPAFRSMAFAAAPIVRVAIEPEHASDMPALVRGMRLLNQADPCVEVSVQPTGEHILATAGEVHLQRCLDDLREQYARVSLNVSSPIIPFRETVVPPPTVDMVNEAISSLNEVALAVQKPEQKGAGSGGRGVVRIQTPNKACTLWIQARPLPPAVTLLLEKNAHLLKALGSLKSGVELNTETQTQLRDLKASLHSAFSKFREEDEEEEEEEEDGEGWTQAVDRLWSFGPRHCGPNVLINGIKSYNRPSVWSSLGGGRAQTEGGVAQIEGGVARDFDNSIISGFQLASLSGPLCEEPLHGVAFVLRDWTYTEGPLSRGGEEEEGEVKEKGKEEEEVKDKGKEEEGKVEVVVKEEGMEEVVEKEVKQRCSGGRKLKDTKRTASPLPTTSGGVQPPVHQVSDTYGPFSGQLISAMKEGCRQAILAQPARLMLAMYSCNITATAEVLGRLYAVLGRRNGRVRSEEMCEGSVAFIIEALVPVAESFGFAEEIRKKTSGLASPQLMFSHWEVIASDPFWVPSTEEELLHFGEKADSENLARRYMNAVRRRKGLRVEEKLVEHGEKQRTRKRNK